MACYYRVHKLKRKQNALEQMKYFKLDKRSVLNTYIFYHLHTFGIRRNLFLQALLEKIENRIV